MRPEVTESSTHNKGSVIELTWIAQMAVQYQGFPQIKVKGNEARKSFTKNNRMHYNNQIKNE